MHRPRTINRKKTYPSSECLCLISCTWYPQSCEEQEARQKVIEIQCIYLHLQSIQRKLAFKAGPLDHRGTLTINNLCFKLLHFIIIEYYQHIWQYMYS